MNHETFYTELRGLLPVPTTGEPWQFCTRRPGQEVALHPEFAPVVLVQRDDKSWDVRPLIPSQN